MVEFCQCGKISIKMFSLNFDDNVRKKNPKETGHPDLWEQTVAFNTGENTLCWQKSGKKLKLEKEELKDYELTIYFFLLTAMFSFL